MKHPMKKITISILSILLIGLLSLSVSGQNNSIAQPESANATDEHGHDHDEGEAHHRDENDDHDESELHHGDDHDDHDDHDQGEPHHSDEHADHDESEPHHGDPDDHDGHDDHQAHVDEVTLTPQAIEQWGIRIERISKQPLQPVLHAPARVSFNQERIAHVGSIVSGRVSEIMVRIGDHAAQGDPLLIVASPELGRSQSEYLQQRTEVDTARVVLEAAETFHRSAKSLYDQTQGIALSEVQKREAQYKAAQGALRAAQGAAVAAENMLHLLGMDQQAVEQLAQSGEVNPYFVVRAPIAGEVIAREATLGESVGPDRDALLIIADRSTLWVLADAPESAVGRIGLGAKATVRSPLLDDLVVQGKVSYLSPQLNTATRTMSVRIEVDGEASGLLPGMFVEVELRSAKQTSKAVLVVPEQAVQTVEGQLAVFVPVEGEPNTFAKRVVRVGKSVGGLTPVLDGLIEGEHYVVSGSFILKADLGKAGAAHNH